MGHSVREVIAKLMVTERGGWEDDAGGRGGAGLTDRADDNVTTGPQVTLLVTHSVSLGREFLCAANTGLPLIIKLVRPQCSCSSPWRRWTAATLTTFETFGRRSYDFLFGYNLFGRPQCSCCSPWRSRW